MKQVILIMVDTQRQDMISAYEKTASPTPNLDYLANNGTKFNYGYTCQPVCGPARSAIFTGIYPHSSGMETNCMPLRRNIKTVGEYLSPQNIECGYVGKWHLDGGDYFGYGKCPEGYNSQYWYDMRNFLDAMESDSKRVLSRKHIAQRSDDPLEEDTFAHQCCDRAINFIEEFKEKDFFLTLSLDEPHDPSICPKRFVRKMDNFHFHRTPNVKANLKYKPAHQKVWAKQHGKIPFWAGRHAFKSLFACNSFCDYEIGRVLNKIKETDIKPMIIYTSDHGDMLLSHRMMGKGCVMYDEITKVPFLISGGAFKVGEINTPVSHIDILPTVFEHFGLKSPKMLQGEALQNITDDTKREIFIEFTRYEVDHDGFMGFQPIRAIFDGEFKLVINLLSDDELYDLKNDQYELKNLINNKKYEKIRDVLHDKLIEKMNSTRDLYRGYYWHCRPWRKGVKPSYNHTGFTRQLEEEDFVQLDYSTGLPMKTATRKK